MVIKSSILVFENIADKKMLNIFLLSCLIASTLSAPSHSIVKKSGNVPAVSLQKFKTSPAQDDLFVCFRGQVRM